MSLVIDGFAAAGNPEIVTWTAKQLGTFLNGIEVHRLHAVFLLLATNGMRRGEALGLRWSDLDLDSGRLAVRQTVIAVHHKVEFGTPKTAKGRRTVMLDVATVAALREHRKRQAAERLSIGAGWTIYLQVSGVRGGTCALTTRLRLP